MLGQDAFRFQLLRFCRAWGWAMSSEAVLSPWLWVGFRYLALELSMEMQALSVGHTLGSFHLSFLNSHGGGMLIGMVDVIFSDVAQPDQARIVTHNAGFFLKNNGWVMISIKARRCLLPSLLTLLPFRVEVDAKKRTLLGFSACCAVKSSQKREPVSRPGNCCTGRVKSRLVTVHKFTVSEHWVEDATSPNHRRRVRNLRCRSISIPPCRHNRHRHDRNSHHSRRSNHDQDHPEKAFRPDI